MPLSAGTKLGPYEILAPIGAGGMGEVYRAHDSRMGRDVAIKVSAEQFSDRFSREVHAVAALNHPNICHLYDVGPDYLVMELVEGPTLAERIKQGAIPLEESLNVAKQIADALEAAHEKGIVHRDLKPGNIKLRPDGTVKVLDFGLAKVTEPASDANGRPEHSPTLTLDAATRVGAILGTAAYMPPEQARGKSVDKRADIWAFGVVLYEILTGERLFEGETVSDTLIEVATREPKWERVPAKVQRLLRRCLQKDPKKRLRDIGDAWELLEDAPQVSAVAATPSRSRLGIVTSITTALFAVALAIAGWGWWRATRPVDRPLVRLDVDLGPEVSLLATQQGSVVISPDGTRLAYVSSAPGGTASIFTRRLDQPKAAELPGTDGASRLMFSPDGQWVGFYAHSKLNKVSVEGGAVVTVSDDPGAHASWGDDGSFVLEKVGVGLVRIPPGGGTPTPVTENSSSELTHAFPEILPGSRAVLFLAVPLPYDPDQARIEVVSLVDRRRKVLVQGGTSPHYLLSGHLVYASKGTLFAVPFDSDKLETRGTAISILDQVAFRPASAGADFDVSKEGTLVYRRGNGGGESEMRTVQWVDGAGKKEPLRPKPGLYSNPRLSPDGKRLAFAVHEGANYDVWVYDAQRDAMTRLTFGGGPYAAPVWTPDGKYVIFGSLKGIYWTRADGASQPQLLTQSKNPQIPWSFTPDGKRLAYYEGSGSPQIWTLPLEEQGGQLKAGKPEQFLKSQFSEFAPAFSPDGHWLAYTSNESGKREVYVRAFPPSASGQGGKWQISNSGGDWPLWSRNGRELIYKADDQLMSVSYSVTGDSFVPEKPRLWIAKLGGTDYYDLAPDGKRVVVLAPVESPEAAKPDHEVTFLFNFFDELRRRVPVGK
jgi:Tol biopolymer transport system component